MHSTLKTRLARFNVFQLRWTTGSSLVQDSGRQVR